jgi:hypothetical protein
MHTLLHLPSLQTEGVRGIDVQYYSAVCSKMVQATSLTLDEIMPEQIDSIYTAPTAH